MKLNSYTLALISAGVVSLPAVVNAEEKGNFVATALSSTTLSGYIDTSAQWNVGTGNDNLPPYKFGGASKADGFNLNVVQLRLDKPLDEQEWAAGYRVDLWAGPDANVLGTISNERTGADFAVRQAYAALRMPIGNGLDWKVGVFDSIIGYESVESPSNPNYTRSYGHSLEPQSHTGVLASYRINDLVSLSAGIANTTGPSINSRAFNSPDADHNKAESYKTYMGSIAITAPDSLGFLAGSTLYAGVVNGFNDNESGSSTDYDANTTSFYLGATLATPVTGLRLGAAWDYLDVHHFHSIFPGDPNNGSAWSLGVYASYQATEKLSLHVRGEYLDDQAEFFAVDEGINGVAFSTPSGFKVWELTGTVQYDLWKNVLTRFEVRWDHGDNASFFSSPGETEVNNNYQRNAVMFAANIIYKF